MWAKFECCILFPNVCDGVMGLQTFKRNTIITGMKQGIYQPFMVNNAAVFKYAFIYTLSLAT